MNSINTPKPLSKVNYDEPHIIKRSALNTNSLIKNVGVKTEANFLHHEDIFGTHQPMQPMKIQNQIIGSKADNKHYVVHDQPILRLLNLDVPKPSKVNYDEPRLSKRDVEFATGLVRISKSKIITEKTLQPDVSLGNSRLDIKDDIPFQSIQGTTTSEKGIISNGDKYTKPINIPGFQSLNIPKVSLHNYIEPHIIKRNVANASNLVRVQKNNIITEKTLQPDVLIENSRLDIKDDKPIQNVLEITKSEHSYIPPRDNHTRPINISFLSDDDVREEPPLNQKFQVKNHSPFELGASSIQT